jgi:hypothetical protein
LGCEDGSKAQCKEWLIVSYQQSDLSTSLPLLLGAPPMEFACLHLNSPDEVLAIGSKKSLRMTYIL